MGLSRIIPEARQPSRLRTGVRTFTVAGPVLEGVTPDGLAGAHVRVLVKGMNDKSPTLVAEDASVSDTSDSGVTLVLDRNQYSQLSDARFGNKQVFLSRRQPEMLADMGVDSDAFQDVGHALFGLMAGVIGGWTGRYFFLTREETREVRAPIQPG